MEGGRGAGGEKRSSGAELRSKFGRNHNDARCEAGGGGGETDQIIPLTLLAALQPQQPKLPLRPLPSLSPFFSDNSGTSTYPRAGFGRPPSLAVLHARRRYFRKPLGPPHPLPHELTLRALICASLIHSFNSFVELLHPSPTHPNYN